jgi:hypothetical protein
MALPGLLLVYAAWSSRVINPAIFGTPLVILGLVIFTNSALASLQLNQGVLSARSLLGRGQVDVDQITTVVPINLRYRRTLVMPWNRSAQMFEVRTQHGPTGFWLNPNVYGRQPIEGLLRAMRIEPETIVQNRFIDVFSTNRDYVEGNSNSSRP